MRTTVAVLGTALIVVVLSLLAAVLERPIYLLLAGIVAATAVAATIYSDVRRSPTRHR